jgi:hypothetical protein
MTNIGAPIAAASSATGLTYGDDDWSLRHGD